MIRSAVPKIELDDVFILKEKLSEDIKESLKHAMDDFGYEILSTPAPTSSPTRR